MSKSKAVAEKGHTYKFGGPSQGWPTFGPDGKIEKPAGPPSEEFKEFAATLKPALGTHRQFDAKGRRIREVPGTVCGLPCDGTPCLAPPHACEVCPLWGEEA